MVAVRLVFSEHDVVKSSKASKMNMEYLFLPYIQAAKSVSGVLSVGVGINLWFPTGLDEPSLRDAGIAVLFTRGAESKSWIRRELALGIGRNA